MKLDQIPITIPTYPTVVRSVLPPLFDSECTYPYSGYLATSDQPQDKTYQAIVIENDLLRVTVLPELGGRIFQIEDVNTGTKYLHDNDVVRPVRIPPRWAFLSLGIELNFPATHSPTGTEPVGYELIRCPGGGVGVAVGERELRWGLCWRAEIKLFPGVGAVCLAVRGWNLTGVTRDVQWWSNAAQPGNDDTEFVFPTEPVVAHIEGEESGRWPVVAGRDRRWHKNYDTMCGLFWEPTREDWFGIYHHRHGWGLLHLADPADLPGKKLWTFGHTGPASDWTHAMTRTPERICEIQSGRPTTQKTGYSLPPGGELAFVEFWVPCRHREDFDDTRRPTCHSLAQRLGGAKALESGRSELPSPSGAFWKALLAAHSAKDTAWVKNAIHILKDTWPPTGLDLEPALKWAAKTAPGAWHYPLGVWFCAHQDYRQAHECFEEALRIDPQCPYARAMQGLVLWKGLHNPRDAWNQIRPALETLPDRQLFLHTDQLLRELNLADERGRWIAQWPSDDFRRREAQAELALDSNRPQEAVHLLTAQPWERHHCRHRRTTLWQQARTMLGQPTQPIPDSLGEDPLPVAG